MRDCFWGTYQTIVFKKFFYEEHQRRSEKLLFWAKLVCSVVSIISVLIWSISKKAPVLWACLIALAQVSQSMLDYLPWSKQLNALRFLLPELNKLIVDLSEDWMKLGYAEVDDDAKLLERTVTHERRYYEIEDQFTNEVWFPVLKSVVAAAEKAEDDYFCVKYSVSEGSETDGPGETKTKTERQSEPSLEEGNP